MRAEMITTDAAPRAVGAYSQAVKANGFVFASGQIGLDPRTGKLVGEDAKAQTIQAMHNLEAVLAAAGSSFEQAVKFTIFMADIHDYRLINETYASCLPEGVRPARAALQAGALPLGAKVEIEVTALVS